MWKSFRKYLDEGHRLKAYKTDEGLERISQHDVYPHKYINKLLENTPAKFLLSFFRATQLSGKTQSNI